MDQQPPGAADIPLHKPCRILRNILSDYYRNGLASISNLTNG